MECNSYLVSSHCSFVVGSARNCYLAGVVVLKFSKSSQTMSLASSACLDWLPDPGIMYNLNRDDIFWSLKTSHLQYIIIYISMNVWLSPDKSHFLLLLPPFSFVFTPTRYLSPSTNNSSWLVLMQAKDQCSSIVLFIYSIIHFAQVFHTASSTVWELSPDCKSSDFPPLILQLHSKTVENLPGINTFKKNPIFWWLYRSKIKVF